MVVLRETKKIKGQVAIAGCAVVDLLLYYTVEKCFLFIPGFLIIYSSPILEADDLILSHIIPFESKVNHSVYMPAYSLLFFHIQMTNQKYDPGLPDADLNERMCPT